MLYGRRGGLPDTTDVEIVSTIERGINQIGLIDLTGDHVPELLGSSIGDILNGPMVETTRIYVGMRGQRLLEQYGSGDDPPRPGRWWRRPWAEIWLPRRIDSGWSYAGDEPIYDLGDVGLDGVGDLCLYCRPSIICYSGGRYFDSLVDAGLPIPGYGPNNDGSVDGVAVLGDIDGSGVPVIAVGYWSGNGAVKFFKKSREVPTWGVERLRPPGTDTAATVIGSSVTERIGVTWWLDASWLHLRWAATAVGMVQAYAVNGTRIGSWPQEPMAHRLEIPLSDWPSGTYVVRAAGPAGSQAIRITIAR